MAVGSTSNARSAAYAMLNIVSASGIVFANKVREERKTSKDSVLGSTATGASGDDDEGGAGCEA